MIEYRHWKKRERAAAAANDSSSSSTGPNVSEIERVLLLGNREGRQQGLIPPELVKWLSGELKDYSKVQKNAREAAEAAAALVKKK